MRSTLLIAPFATWMVLLTLLPSTPWAYAVRTMITVGALCFSICGAWRLGWRLRVSPRDVLWGLIAGLLVLVIWVAPESLAWYRRWCIYGEGGTDCIAESFKALIVIRLIGSACVISVAEELFFRKWLVRFAGFGWMVAIFAIEHDRFVVGAIAGVIYGLLAMRRGLVSAIVAHATTNLLLGFWVLYSGQWQFW